MLVESALVCSLLVGLFLLLLLLSTHSLARSLVHMHVLTRHAVPRVIFWSCGKERDGKGHHCSTRSGRVATRKCFTSNPPSGRKSARKRVSGPL